MYGKRLIERLIRLIFPPNRILDKTRRNTRLLRIMQVPSGLEVTNVPTEQIF
jgi:hypothetical protein